MAFYKRTLLYSVLILLVSSFGNIAAQSCGGDYTADYGEFTSPNYPNVYDLNSECTYTISPSDINAGITLSFETFELDRSAGDYLLISCEGNTGFVSKNFSWTATIAPISIPSFDSVRLDFYSDSYRNYSTRGFKVQYQVNTWGCDNTVFTSLSGIISSPNHPQDYNDDENCTYSIWSPETSSFTLVFQAFDLESDCQSDWVQIRCDNGSYILPKYCGSTLPKPAYISSCNKVLIWFHTDSSNRFSGFSLQYSITPYGCGKLENAGLSGIITSPNYPKKYYYLACRYFVFPVSSVALAFQSFDLEPFIDSVSGDFVEIELLHSDSPTDYHRYRGNTLPPLISCPLCYRVHVFFHGNPVISGTGFNVRYQVNPIVAHSAITNAPQNFTVEVGSRVELNCISNAIDYYPSWTLSKDGTEENTTVIASYCYFTFSKYSVVKGGPGVCKLVITNATLTDSGIYTCIDVGLASISSVVTVVVPTTASTPNSQGSTSACTSRDQVPTTTSTSNGQAQADTNVSVIVLAVLLAISALGYIGIAIFVIVRRCKETTRKEDQRKTNQDMRPVNKSGKTQATVSAYDDILFPALSSATATRSDDCGYEHLSHGFDNHAAYDSLKRQSSLNKAVHDLG